MKLEQQVESISSRQDFSNFVRSLALSLREIPDIWENADLEQFLEALAAWVEDMDGYFENRGEPIPQTLDWKLLGKILLAAKIYD